jgi:hypothetical protein
MDLSPEHKQLVTRYIEFLDIVLSRYLKTQTVI